MLKCGEITPRKARPMQITTPQDRTDTLVEELTFVWRASVEATHDFLSAQDVDRIADYVPEAIRTVPSLVTACDDDGRALGFAGAGDGKLEMLFIEPAHRGKGVGAMLLDFAIRELGVTHVDVNEQNAQARGFYEHKGFEVIGRSETDEQGEPFPILHMRLKARSTVT